jgi:hypothetical protein
MTEEREEALREMIRLAEELKLYDLPPEVCTVHKRFVPCRKDGEHLFASDPDSVRMVLEFHREIG